MPAGTAWSPERALIALLDALDEGALLFDEHGRCRAAGRRAAELLGLELDPRALLGLLRRDILARAAASFAPAALEALSEQALAGGGGSTVVDPVPMGGPEARAFVWTSMPIAVEEGAPAGRLDILRDVSRERRAEAASRDMERRLEEESGHDELTGLANRRRFEEEHGREHRRSQRAWASYVIARFAVDGMVGLNAAHGRATIDAILRRVADALRAERREYDVVARLGDDELVLLLPGVDGAAAHGILKRALDAVRAHTAPEPAMEASPVTASAGAAVWTPPSAEAPADLLRRSASALAVACARGPGALEIDPGGYGGFSDSGTVITTRAEHRTTDDRQRGATRGKVAARRSGSCYGRRP